MSAVHERVLPVDHTVAAAEPAAEAHEEHESVDLEGWALVDDQAEIVGLEPRSAPRDAAAVTAAHADVHTGTTSTDTTTDDNHAHKTQQQQQQQQHSERERVGSTTREVEPPSDRDDMATAVTEPPAASDDFASAASTGSASVVVPDGYLRVRVRVGEHVRPAWCKATQIVDDFVAKFFADAVAEGKRVRLIYMGMLLIHDRAMGEYGIEEDGVIHCVITDAPRASHPQAAQNPVLKGLSNPANSLLVLTGVALYGLWTLFYHFPHLFSWKSILLLSLFSAAHVSATIARFSV